MRERNGVTVRLRRICWLNVLMATAAALPAFANDWPFWRGPEQTGMSREKAPVTSWSIDGDNVLWKVPVGGRTTPIVMGGRVFAITPVGSGECLQERVICLDGETGKTIWEHRFNVFHTDIVEARLGWTSVVGDPETGNIYAHGTGGEFFCFNRDGKVLWKHSLGEEFGRYSGYGGRLHTPIIDEDRVIISFQYILSQWGTGKQKAGHRYYAFDKRTGEVLWSAQPGGKPLDTTYSAPVVAVINGKRMLIAANADGGAYGMLARTGERVWSFDLSKRGINASVVVDGNYAYVCHSEENLDDTEMGRVVCIDASKTGDITKTGEVWRADGLGVGYSSPAVANGRLYVVTNSAHLICLDAKTGERFWEYELGTVMKGSPVVTSDGIIYAGEVNGRFHILRDKGDSCESLDFDEFPFRDSAAVEISGSPSVANGRVYFMNNFDMYCLGKREMDKTANAAPIPPMGKEMTKAESADKTYQLIPAEATLEPGKEVKYHVAVYNDIGQLVKKGAVGDVIMQATPLSPWTVKGVHGKVTADGTFHADSEDAYSAGEVTLALPDGKTASARVRVTRPLPIRESFDGLPVGDIPPGWIGLDAKTELTTHDGNIVLMKKALSPSAPFSRMRAFSGPVIPVGYTVEADLMAEPKEGRRPTLSDMGLINNRYKLILLGYEKAIRLVTYTPIPRLQLESPFDWNPSVWYRAKLRVDIIGDKSLVRGKVWPRDDEEPKAWTIEMTDPCPNWEGSPGLYAYSKGTTPSRHGSPVYFDNYEVYRNDHE